MDISVGTISCTIRPYCWPGHMLEVGEMTLYIYEREVAGLRFLYEI